MNLVEKRTTDLIEYENNPRHNEQAVDAVANSIKEFGFKVPIVIDANNVIVAGHTRLKAAKKLGIETVPCIIADDLSEEQIKAFRLADNKVGELAEWDFDKLQLELSELENFQMEQFGFDLEEFANDIEVEEDEVPEVDEEAEPIVKRGQVWKLGNHYLMCGDSTKKEDIEKLLSASEVNNG